MAADDTDTFDMRIAAVLLQSGINVQKIVCCQKALLRARYYKASSGTSFTLFNRQRLVQPLRVAAYKIVSMLSSLSTAMILNSLNIC